MYPFKMVCLPDSLAARGSQPCRQYELHWCEESHGWRLGKLLKVLKGWREERRRRMNEKGDG